MPTTAKQRIARSDALKSATEASQFLQRLCLKAFAKKANKQHRQTIRKLMSEYRPTEELDKAEEEIEFINNLINQGRSIEEILKAQQDRIIHFCYLNLRNLDSSITENEVTPHCKTFLTQRDIDRPDFDISELDKSILHEIIAARTARIQRETQELKQLKATVEGSSLQTPGKASQEPSENEKLRQENARLQNELAALRKQLAAQQPAQTSQRELVFSRRERAGEGLSTDFTPAQGANRASP